MILSRRLQQLGASVAVLATTVTAQTWSACNPLYSSGCPANQALGMAIDVDFTRGEVNSFAKSGNPTYGPDGVTFTVSRPGEAPQLTSLFYIMFGRVEVTMKCAPGAGIVSSLVLQSDTLDEIDIEWLGADSGQMQTNYFGKGQTGNYDRGQFNPAPNNQAEFVTYSIDWTADRVVWSVGGKAVRVLNFNDAKGQYPQTPMQVKFGAWSGGDPGNNAPGTVEWARGPTDYSKGPFSMVARRIVVTDYSTGKQYKYGDSSGTWQSIQAVDGKVNGNLGRSNVPVVTSAAAPANSLSPSVPAGGIGAGGGSSTVRPTGTIPDGWVMTPSGKVVPAGATVTPPPSSGPSSSPFAPPGADGENGPAQVVTTYDGRGFPTTLTIPAGWTRGIDAQGNPAAVAATAAPQLSEADALANGFSSGQAASGATAARPTWALGTAVSLALGLYLYLPA